MEAAWHVSMMNRSSLYLRKEGGGGGGEERFCDFDAVIFSLHFKADKRS